MRIKTPKYGKFCLIVGCICGFVVGFCIPVDSSGIKPIRCEKSKTLNVNLNGTLYEVNLDGR